MPITRTAMVDDDGSGTTGTIFNNAWKQELYDQIDALSAAMSAGAPWIIPPFNPADYFVSIGTGTWPVVAADVVNTTYVVNGKTLSWNISVNQNAPITGSPIGLSRRAFGPHKIARVCGGIFIYNLTSVGYWQCAAGIGDNGQINFFKDINGSVPWTAAATIRAQGFYEIVG
jgi:hypothetical protein